MKTMRTMSLTAVLLAVAAAGCLPAPKTPPAAYIQPFPHLVQSPTPADYPLASAAEYQRRAGAIRSQTGQLETNNEAMCMDETMLARSIAEISGNPYLFPHERIARRMMYEGLYDRLRQQIAASRDFITNFSAIEGYNVSRAREKERDATIILNGGLPPPGY